MQRLGRRHPETWGLSSTLKQSRTLPFGDPVGQWKHSLEPEDVVQVLIVPIMNNQGGTCARQLPSARHGQGHETHRTESREDKQQHVTQGEAWPGDEEEEHVSH